ncbi:transcriptional regulator, TetR/AcrR family [Arcobacter venerupis]|uniref:Transcriptional regulator, TetR/AcrR family n=1 Tax=Arcobacter venerupis TaxID=1054033 RepID=A0AAE7E506_9BACT|nr:TetR/AcrR family transcriptional regulator [Arcobacter venerupis]QKF68455.1 transcriptional regulator, TetR/AcrR family [Arcobacter venerupis]RWS48961.1 TetR family transcriptional regulator [Arcobacter venerupis]
MSTKNKIDKNHLINIIEDIILSEGLSGLSIRKVAAKANISIGGVQYIFGNKEDMIKAVFDKNEDDYNHQIKILSKDTSLKYSELKAHIEYISKYNSNEELDKISKVITILLQDKSVFEGLQDWHSSALESIDTNTDEGKKLRLAFLFSEAMFTSMTLKYINLSDKEQKEVFEDLKTFLL